MGNAPSSEEEDAFEPPRSGYRVLSVAPNSPGASLLRFPDGLSAREGITTPVPCELVAFFDLIVSINGIILDSQAAKEDVLTREVAKQQPCLIEVWSSSQRRYRSCQLTPRKGWGGEGLLGVQVRFDSSLEPSEATLESCGLHIVAVEPHSPAEKAGLKEEEEYLLGSVQGPPFASVDDFVSFANDRIGEQAQVFVYRKETDSVRLATLNITEEPWGPERQVGVGLELATGHLHALPRNNTLGKNEFSVVVAAAATTTVTTATTDAPVLTGSLQAFVAGGQQAAPAASASSADAVFAAKPPSASSSSSSSSSFDRSALFYEAEYQAKAAAATAAQSGAAKEAGAQAEHHHEHHHQEHQREQQCDGSHGHDHDHGHSHSHGHGHGHEDHAPTASTGVVAAEAAAAMPVPHVPQQHLQHYDQQQQHHHAHYETAAAASSISAAVTTAPPFGQQQQQQQGQHHVSAPAPAPAPQTISSPFAVGLGSGPVPFVATRFGAPPLPPQTASHGHHHHHSSHHHHQYPQPVYPTFAAATGGAANNGGQH